MNAELIKAYRIIIGNKTNITAISIGKPTKEEVEQHIELLTNQETKKERIKRLKRLPR